MHPFDIQVGQDHESRSTIGKGRIDFDEKSLQITGKSMFDPDQKI